MFVVAAVHGVGRVKPVLKIGSDWPLNVPSQVSKLGPMCLCQQGREQVVTMRLVCQAVISKLHINLKNDFQLSDQAKIYN